MCVFFFKQKTAYEMRISDWSSDVCSSDLFMGALGSARGISSEAISTDLAMATFGGIAAGFSAALLGLRCGRRLPLIIGTLALVLSSIGLVSDTANYSLCAILFLFSWVFVTSYFMGTVAAVEDGGRAAVFIPAAQLGGLAQIGRAHV